MPDRKVKAFAEEFVLARGSLRKVPQGLGESPQSYTSARENSVKVSFVTIGTIFAHQLADKVSKEAPVWQSGCSNLAVYVCD
jgi:hypothetical protein